MTTQRSPQRSIRQTQRVLLAYPTLLANHPVCDLIRQTGSSVLRRIATSARRRGANCRTSVTLSGSRPVGRVAVVEEPAEQHAVAVANFAFELGVLKRMRRAGWWHAGVRDPESVAEHSLRVAQLASLIAAIEGAEPSRAALPLVHPCCIGHSLD